MRIGIDLGGTKTEGIALSNEGAELARLRVPTAREYKASLDTIVSLVQELEQTTRQRGTVGIGIPGAISPATGLVKNANTVSLNGQPLGRDLEALLGREVRVMNDANCFALSEATDGAGADGDVVFGVILGTGVGAGIVVGGRCLIGPNLIAGEWGHNPLPWMTSDEYPGPGCYCGKRGCVESFLSGPGFERDHLTHSGEIRSSREIVAAAAGGSPSAVETLARYHDRLARALASVMNRLDPSVVVLGGGMSNIAGLAEDTAKGLPRYVFSDLVETPVVRHKHGDSSGVRGAAWLWPLET